MKNFRTFLRESSEQIVKTKTIDNVLLEGSFLSGSETAIAHTHGTASFYNNEAFEPPIREYCKQNNYSFLTFNNRGANIQGATKELFSDSPKDIQAWIDWLQTKGIKNIILSGHSLGTEKVANFIKSATNIKAILLFAPSDTIGNQERYEKKINHSFFKEAQYLQSIGKGNRVLSDPKAHAGVLPMTANAYLDFYTPGKPLETALPFRLRSNRLEQFTVPCYALVPDNDHYNITSTKDYISDLNAAGAKTIKCHTDHDFNNFDTLKVLNDLRIV